MNSPIVESIENPMTAYFIPMSFHYKLAQYYILLRYQRFIYIKRSEILQFRKSIHIILSYIYEIL